MRYPSAQIDLIRSFERTVIVRVALVLAVARLSPLLYSTVALSHEHSSKWKEKKNSSGKRRKTQREQILVLVLRLSSELRLMNLTKLTLA